MVPDETALLSALDEFIANAPLRHMIKPGGHVRHWSLVDPAAAPKQERLAAFQSIRGEIADAICRFLVEECRLVLGSCTVTAVTQRDDGPIPYPLVFSAIPASSWVVPLGGHPPPNAL